MEKKIYQTPFTEQIYMELTGQLLDIISLDEGFDDNVPGAKRNVFIEEDFDFLEDEDIEPCWTFNVWED